MDTKATVEQIVKLYEAGCEIARVTAPSVAAAENLKNIHQELDKRGIYIPLVADIHFTPNAALVAAEYVEKVRINPGNYAEKSGHLGDYTDLEYQLELERIEEKFRPLVLRCRERGVAMRIGTNHGSLSQRIMSRFGDTPEGMVESAMEFIYFAEALNFNQIILSMKASNPQIMIWAYRLLTERMIKENRTYPLHLGVTEAGGGLEGRVKSAAGIYSLLYDGIGDTIRVSLTEDPVNEIPVARSIINAVDRRMTPSITGTILENNMEVLEKIPDERDPYSWTKEFRDEVFPGLTGEKALVIHELKSVNSDMLREEMAELEKLEPERKPDVLIAAHPDRSFIDVFEEKAEEFSIITDKLLYDLSPRLYAGYLVGSHELLLEIAEDCNREKWVVAIIEPPREGDEDLDEYLYRLQSELDIIADFAEEHQRTVVLLDSPAEMGFARIVNTYMKQKAIEIPLILAECENGKKEFVTPVAGKLGGLLLDGIGDGILLRSEGKPAEIMDLVFSILQASRLRITRTEYISCPSCGRTLFDLEKTTALIQEKTSHLKGLKIGVMGCIVNGPGEMADADFGYVGAGKNKITLYVGHKPVKKNIPEKKAVDELIELIKEHGRWIEP
jgi:(E)-4-hydroxy-3-methylbut-2-enyl-diphosphate synthase